MIDIQWCTQRKGDRAKGRWGDFIKYNLTHVNTCITTSHHALLYITTRTKTHIINLQASLFDVNAKADTRAGASRHQ
jgi:hypothetical protein